MPEYVIPIFFFLIAFLLIGGFWWWFELLGIIKPIFNRISGDKNPSTTFKFDRRKHRNLYVHLE